MIDFLVPHMRTCWKLLVPLIGLAMSCNAQDQVADASADVHVARPRFAKEQGPRLVIDAAHANFHTATGRFKPFADLARNDGFVVEAGMAPFSDSSLTGVDVLVIANASPAAGSDRFTASEIAALRRHVANGGALLLIADHTPYPSAVHALAKAFSIQFRDVYAEDDGTGLFTQVDGGLAPDTLTAGLERIRTFGGSAFTIDGLPYRPILVMREGWTLQHPVPSGLSEKTSAEGLLQGAVLHFGKGRIAVFGEAAMFTAQVAGRRRIGFNAPDAEENKTLVLNILRWLGASGH